MSKMNDFQVKNKHILHGGISNATLRNWQCLKCEINENNLMYPIFIIDDDNAVQSIKSMPGVSRYGINKLKEHLTVLVKKGLKSVLLFGVIEQLEKDDYGKHADSTLNPVIRALPKLREWFPTLTIACDVCLCPYTSHGHCGILNENGTINNRASLKRIAAIALEYARNGANIVAPSDMMDGRINAIKTLLIQNNLANQTAILSYTAKFASNFYGPFRDAAKSKPTFGDRKSYQFPIGGQGLAIRAADRDIDEGADMLMVKPIMLYLDILKEIKTKYPQYPMFVYQVSGEYAMIYNAAQQGIIDLKSALGEILTSIRRAGGDVIITYFTPIILDWLELKHKL